MTDVVLIGAGVAGISAAIWLIDQDFRLVSSDDSERATFRWLEASDRIGGVLHEVHNPLPQLFVPADNGAAYARRLAGMLEERDLAPEFGVRVLRVQPTDDEVAVVTARETLRASLVIVATGTRRRRLGLPGEREHLGRGVARSGRAERDRFRGRRVVIVGGGDAALENALLLSEVGASVHLIHRSREFSARQEFQRQVAEDPAIQVELETTVSGIEAQAGAAYLDAVLLSDGRRLEAEGLLVRIGVDADGPEIEGIERRRGFYPASGHPRVLTIGDCMSPEFRSVPVAIGHGAQAARDAALFLGLRSP